MTRNDVELDEMGMCSLHREYSDRCECSDLYDGCCCGSRAPCECGHCSCEHCTSRNPSHTGAVYCTECECSDYNQRGGAVFDAMVFATTFALAWVGVALMFSF